MQQIRFQNKTLLTFSVQIAPSHVQLQPILGPMLTLLLVNSGEAVLRIDGNRYQMTPGDIFVINAVEPAHIQAIVPPQLSFTRLCFDSALVASSSNKNTFDYHYLEMFYNRQHVATHKIGASYAESPALRRLFGEIGRVLDTQDVNSIYAAKNRLLDLLLGILNYYEHDHLLNPKDEMNAGGNEIIEQVVQYIEENLSQTLTLPMFAEIAHMNPFYFSTFFKKHTSVSPMQFVLRARIQRATCLLKETDKTILDIALLCGFNSTANFNKAFKKITGKTPSDFRGSGAKDGGL